MYSEYRNDCNQKCSLALVYLCAKFKFTFYARLNLEVGHFLRLESELRLLSLDGHHLRVGRTRPRTRHNGTKQVYARAAAYYVDVGSLTFALV